MIHPDIELKSSSRLWYFATATLPSNLATSSTDFLIKGLTFSTPAGGDHDPFTQWPGIVGIVTRVGSNISKTTFLNQKSQLGIADNGVLMFFAELAPVALRILQPILVSLDKQGIMKIIVVVCDKLNQTTLYSF